MGQNRTIFMLCNTDSCPVIEHTEEICPFCKGDEIGRDSSDQQYEDRCDSLAAEQFEFMAHAGKQDDWSDSTSDPILYNDAGEPIGHC